MTLRRMMCLAVHSVFAIAGPDAVDLLGDIPLDVTFFANGGLVIQFNVHDAETLRDAQVGQDRFIRRAEEVAQ